MSEIPKLILVKKILVNPNNPRFYEDTPSSTEIDAINAMIALKFYHYVKILLLKV